MRECGRRLVSGVVCLVMVLGLCGCGGNNDWVFQLNGERLYKQDVAAFAYIYTTEYNIKSEEQLEEIYEDTTTYGDFYKQQLEEDIVSTVLLYKEADKNHVKLSDDGKEQIQLATADVMERFGESVLEEAGISESDIEHVYEMKMLAEAYLENLSKDEESAEVTENETERYVKMYQVTFPTVELDENGMVVSDAEGNLKKVSATEISNIKQVAMEFAKSAQQGEDMEQLLKTCDVNTTGVEKYVKYADLESEYQTAIDNLAQGEISDVVESDYGFCVIRLLESNAVEYSEEILSHETETEQVAAKEDERKRLYSEYAQPNKEYKNVDMWDSIHIQDYIR